VSYRIEWLEEPAAFAELEPGWDEMAGPGSRPFDLHCWFSAWFEAFGEPGTMRVCVAWDGERLAAALPLFQRTRRALMGMANVHSPAFGPVGHDPEAVRAVVAAALARCPGRLELPGVPVAEPWVATLAEEAGRAGRGHVAAPGHVSPIVITEGAYEDWRASSKPRWGAPLERFRRKMARDHEAELSIVAPPADLEGELARGFAVEASGWKGQSGTAILSDERTTAFYRRLAAGFAARDGLRLSWIGLDGDWAAFDLCLLHGGRLYLLKTGYDERFRRLAPGLVMRLSVVERCFELGLRAHELLGDESEWKRKFATGERVHSTFHAFETGVRGRASRAYRLRARPQLKRAYERALDRSRR